MASVAMFGLVVTDHTPPGKQANITKGRVAEDSSLSFMGCITLTPRPYSWVLEFLAKNK